MEYNHSLEEMVTGKAVGHEAARLSEAEVFLAPAVSWVGSL